MTLPQVIAAIGNANVNVGGRKINIGQQSVNIRGVGLMDAGGDADLTQGYHVDDIENVVLAQANGVPIQVKDVAKVRSATCRGSARPAATTKTTWSPPSW